MGEQYAREEGAGETSSDFLEKHDAEGERAEEEERPFLKIGDGVRAEPIFRRAIDEAGIKEEEGIVETRGDGFRKSAGGRAVKTSHRGGDHRAEERRKA